MQSKYKVGLLRGNLLLAALLPALLAPASPTLSETLLLCLASGWLGVTAMLVEFSHRRPAQMLWQLIPSLLLASLLWISPERHLIWLWAWAALIMLPQPSWMVVLNGLLAALGWWWLMHRLPSEPAAIAGLLLAALTLLGLIRTRELLPRRGLARRRAKLIPGLRLWTRDQLSRDLLRERARARREGIHCELLLLRVPRRRFWPLARKLCRLTHGFEHCYRLDGRTLAVLLPNRDADRARRRRDELLVALQHVRHWQGMSLEEIASLSDSSLSLERRRAPAATEGTHG